MVGAAAWYLQRQRGDAAIGIAPVEPAPPPRPQPRPAPRPAPEPVADVALKAEPPIEPAPEPVLPIVSPEIVEVGDLEQAGEPEVHTAPPPRKKAAARKKAAPKKKAAPAKKVAVWVDPDGSTCPTSHPVKAKLSSKLFHLPGMLAYTRTKPDRCYRDEDAAVADGLTKAKR